MGFEFDDDAMYEQAKREVDNLVKIRKNFNIKSKEKLLEFYNKLIEEKIFVTPIGIEYLRKLQQELYDSDGIDKEAVRAIPAESRIEMVSNILDTSDKEKEKRRQRELNRYKDKCVKLIMVNIVMFVVIVVMFIITRRSDKIDIDFYRESIENDYLQWENNLQERESRMREQETVGQETAGQETIGQKETGQKKDADKGEDVQ